MRKTCLPISYLMDSNNQQYPLHSSTISLNNNGNSLDFLASVCSQIIEQQPKQSNFSNNMVLKKEKPKPYKCTYCSKSFSKKAHMISHTRIHTGEKPFSCSICSRQFTQKSTLNRHYRVHSGDKPYECSACGKAFAQQSTLSSHLRTHTGEKPFICKVIGCGKKFNKSGHLYRHTRTSHKVSQNVSNPLPTMVFDLP